MIFELSIPLKVSDTAECHNRTWNTTIDPAILEFVTLKAWCSRILSSRTSSDSAPLALYTSSLDNLKENPCLQINQDACAEAWLLVWVVPICDESSSRVGRWFQIWNISDHCAPDFFASIIVTTEGDTKLTARSQVYLASVLRRFCRRIWSVFTEFDALLMKPEVIVYVHALLSSGQWVNRYYYL